MFINTLQPPFYDKMIGSVSSKFSDLVIIGERVEMGLKSGKIASGYTGLNNTKKLPASANKKKEEESHFVASNPVNPSFVRRPYAAATSQISGTISQHLQGNQDSYESQGKNYRGRKFVHFDPIPMTYAELLPHLVSNSMVALCPGKTIEPPYPKGYDSNAVCDYHFGAVGHSTENCLDLKFKVHDLLKVGWLNFKENEPSVNNNPLPVHGGPIVNAIEENHQLIKEVEKIKASMGLIFLELCKFGLIQGNVDVKARCNFHLNEDHSIEECNEFKKELQKLINIGTIQIGRWEKDDGMIATQSEEKLGITIPKPLVIHFTKEESMNAPGDLRTLIVQIPSPFSYKDNKVVPWNYNVEVHLAKQKDKDVSSSKTTAVTNVSGIGMTRNDRICSPGKSQREMRVVFEKAYTDKEEKKVENEKVENEVSNEEAQEFLKIIKQSEYKIVDQLNHTPTRISLLSLLMNSESHRKLLMKILNEAHVTHDITVDKFGGIINNITANNHLTFTDDELPTEGRGHNKALHISVMCLDHIMSRVLIDNGSSLNVISKSTLAKLPCDGTYMRPSPMVVRAFDGSRREVMGEIDLPIQIGPVTFEITFHVMDIVLAYSCLLGRPSIHSAGVVPSTLHQKLKYIERIPICDIRRSFQSARPTSEIHIAAAEDDMFDGEVNWIRPCGVGVEIRNWKVVKSLIIFNAIPIFWNSSFTNDCTKISLHNLNHLVSQTEKDNEEDYEPPLDLLRAIEQEAQGIMPFEEPIEIVNLGTEEGRKEIKVGTILKKEVYHKLIELLHEYKDVFAWSYQDMPGFDTSIVEHKLPLKPDSSPVKKKLRRMKLDMSLKIREEIQKQFDAGFLAVANYPHWIANIVPVPKKD
ncbi:uncharacterized protein [Cicer arietinum]|uniref:Uncharacterized protein LOC101512032 n=1 Tax=Cicer arietinum TaxID=3827 RepID=A0A3Q7XGM2_CICAR|nr:uncharacterized protein LOC101512032 [Cicer arietinum]